MKIIDGNTIPRKRRYIRPDGDNLQDIKALVENDSITRQSINKFWDFGDLIEIKGKYYHGCSLSNDIFIVEESKIIDKEETDYNSEPVCPYCGQEEEAFERQDEDEIECVCGAIYKMQRDVTVEYYCKIISRPKIGTVKDLIDVTEEL